MPLAWLTEYQILLSFKLKLKVTDAYWFNSISLEYNVLVIKRKGYYNSNK